MRKPCLHRNLRGYGQCVLEEGHPPVHNGGGIYYAHMYDPPSPDDFARRAMGTLDTFEVVGRRSDVASVPPGPEPTDPYWDHEETRRAWGENRHEILDILRGLANGGRPHVAPGPTTWDQQKAATERLEEWRARATDVLGSVDT